MTDRNEQIAARLAAATPAPSSVSEWPNNDDTFTPEPILWRVQLADESRDCDGTYPLTAHYVMARCQDEAENRAGEDFDISEGVPVVGPHITRPATGDEIRTYVLALAPSLVAAVQNDAHREVIEQTDAWIAEGIAYFEIHATGEAGEWWLSQIKRVFDRKAGA